MAKRKYDWPNIEEKEWPEIAEKIKKGGLEAVGLPRDLLSHLDGEINFIRSIEEKNQMTLAVAREISQAESAILSLEKLLDQHPGTRSQSINSVVISFKHLMISIDPSNEEEAIETCKYVIKEFKNLKKQKKEEIKMRDYLFRTARKKDLLKKGGTRKRNHNAAARMQRSRRR